MKEKVENVYNIINRYIGLSVECRKVEVDLDERLLHVESNNEEICSIHKWEIDELKREKRKYFERLIETTKLYRVEIEELTSTEINTLLEQFKKDSEEKIVRKKVIEKHRNPFVESIEMFHYDKEWSMLMKNASKNIKLEERKLNYEIPVIKDVIFNLKDKKEEKEGLELEELINYQLDVENGHRLRLNMKGVDKPYLINDSTK